MKRSSGARIAATLAVSTLSLALVTGCGSDSDDTPPAKGLSTAELKKLVIAQGDVEGYKVDATGKQLPKSKSEVTTTEVKCEPLAYVMGGLAPGDSASDAAVMTTEEKSPTDTASKSLEDLSEDEIEDSLTNAMSLDLTVVGLSSYDGDSAEKTFESVSDAVEGCAGGFPVTMQGEAQKITKISTEKTSGTGDESVAFAAVSDLEDGDKGTTHIEVVRHGSTIATYYTINIGLMMSDKAYDIPAALIDAQSAKLK